MNEHRLSRRNLLSAGTLATCGVLAGQGNVPAADKRRRRFRYCFNTSTIRGQELSLEQEIDVTARAGYDGIEPWVSKLHKYVQNGGSLRDIRKRIEDRGLVVESAIAFGSWIVDDDERRAKGFEQVKRDMDVLAQIGGTRIAAGPAGANRTPGLDLLKAAERYRQLLELGEQTGVVPQLEIWGPSANLHRLGEAMFVLVESGHPKACLLPDVYHIYKGGSDHTGLKCISAQAMHVFHMNDYPADPPRETIGDRDRVMPGDGIAPTNEILHNLRNNDCYPALSLELFSPAYWRKDPQEVAELGLEKMKNAVGKALATA